MKTGEFDSHEYFSTRPTSAAIDLARTIRFVREHPAKHLQQVSTLLAEKQMQLEDANIAASLKYAQMELAI